LEPINVLYAHAAQHQIETKRDYLLPDDYFHLNPRGHAVLAEALSRFPVDEGLVPPRNL
jgi:lysophospholipase L1-like esterase